MLNEWLCAALVFSAERLPVAGVEELSRSTCDPDIADALAVRGSAGRADPGRALWWYSSDRLAGPAGQTMALAQACAGDAETRHEALLGAALAGAPAGALDTAAAGWCDLHTRISRSGAELAWTAVWSPRLYADDAVAIARMSARLRADEDHLRRAGSLAALARLGALVRFGALGEHTEEIAGLVGEDRADPACAHAYRAVLGGTRESSVVGRDARTLAAALACGVRGDPLLDAARRAELDVDEACMLGHMHPDPAFAGVLAAHNPGVLDAPLWRCWAQDSAWRHLAMRHSPAALVPALLGALASAGCEDPELADRAEAATLAALTSGRYGLGVLGGATSRLCDRLGENRAAWEALGAVADGSDAGFAALATMALAASA